MASAIQRQEKNTIILTLNVPIMDIASTREKLTEEIVQTAEVKGFRKGKAPRKAVEEQIDKAKLNEEILKVVLPKAYADAVREHNIQPIVNPRIEIILMEKGKDWQFKATTCEKPDVKLGDYKDKVKTVTAKTKIVIPGKEPEKPKAEDIFNALLEGTSVDLPDFVVDAEVDRLLSHTLNEIKSLGLTLDSYLASTGKTTATLREEYKKQAETDLKLEFVLEAIADSENITIAQAEIDEAIKQIKQPQEQEAVKNNPYMLAQILRKQKTLDFVRNM